MLGKSTEGGKRSQQQQRNYPGCNKTTSNQENFAKSLILFWKRTASKYLTQAFKIEVNMKKHYSYGVDYIKSKVNKTRLSKNTWIISKLFDKRDKQFQVIVAVVLTLGHA